MRYLYKFIFIFLLFFYMIICSCSRKRDYKFIVYNKTDYNINSLIIGSGNDMIKFKVAAHDTSEIVVWHFGGTYFNFTEPLVSINVSEYADSIQTYKNINGSLASIIDLKKKTTNIIEILKREKVGNEYVDIFEIKVNE